MAIIAFLSPQVLSAAPFAAYVMDARTGKEIYSQNANARLHPASLTKMMTLYMAFTAIERGQVRLDSKFTVSQHAASQAPSRLGLRPGQQIELRYLIRAAAVKSANDAATTIGEGLAGSEPKFAQQMTAMARALGMSNTNFVNANGLTAAGHYSSARDMSILGRRLFYDFPQYYSIFSRRSADAGIATVASTNRRFLDSYQGADGIKTGYTRAAGFNLTASAQRGNKRIIATVLGGTSTAMRNTTMAQLLDMGFGKAPTQVREIKPAAPTYMVERKRSIQVSPADPAPVVTAAAPVRRTKGSTVPLAAAAQPVSAPAKAGTAARPAVAPSPAVAEVDGTTRPNRRPGAAVNTDAAVASALKDAPAKADTANRPTASPRRQSAVTETAPAAVVLASAPALIEDGEVIEEGDATDTSVAPSASPAPQKKSEGIILAAMDLNSDEMPATETVTRVRVGKGGFGVTLGAFQTRREAESVLVKTALQESGTLSGSARSVSDTRKGFVPNFGGLSRAAAQLTCDKLNARQVSCNVIGG
ncbi:MAG: D-alanyl-D-alanine carboxypeptidase [Paracoccus denitrificans]|nr:MAG: D-alanyl-D-alanine carboxypeptidase [Paracoccus denitrificans]PZO82940.1 MAG: D-alanyl-D-alanine carboxypeptidase [Paracoccus denitrificans]